MPVWGTAKTGTKVTVTFGQQVKSSDADKDGTWMVRLDVLKASAVPAEMIITSATGNQSVKINDVLVGEVYLCGTSFYFGKTDLVCSGSLYKSSTIEGNKFRIAFDFVGKGLMVGSKNGKNPVQEVAGGKLKQFAIAGPASQESSAVGGQAAQGEQPALKWVWTDAVIEGNTVVVSSPEVSIPVAVHYADSRNPEVCNLYNKDGLPASPFFTKE